MVVGPPTTKTLPKDPEPALDELDIDFEPLATSSPLPLPPPPPPPPTPDPLEAATVIIKGSSRKSYYVSTVCADCRGRLDFAVRTTPISILHLQQLLTRDLALLCPTCEAHTRRRKRNGRR
ncbi:early protein E7 [Camelus dromedarius papillomavirus 3]|nr:early protein E7 [Camelus dromedarius papillomavirus 3]